ncbi:MAG: saccharopine dehydrogenase NADP-binding domain-containing protein [Candidatus Stahlbacteria bacterium]|nr:saccharopine dehydrogenase NADP-binding domain-containing protein [Candidatus Stahlbacteria bacterium]
MKRSSVNAKKVLILGAGLVAKPLVRYLLGHNFNVVMLTRTVSKAENMIACCSEAEIPLRRDHPMGEAHSVDVTTDFDKLNTYIPNADVVISLLPYTYHPKVAELCIKYKKHLVTTSYVSEPMKSLDSQAKAAGIIILNEIGLDPGIDHMSAMKIIHDVQNKGGEIKAFNSYCGGLPAPEANTNPWGYKFSWSPRGVVLAAKNKARYLKEGKEVNIAGEHLFDDYATITIDKLATFEAYPNRDSIPYIEKYGIPTTETMARWTLRYPSWCKTWKIIKEIGLLDEAELNLDSITYRKLLSEKLNVKLELDVRQKFEWLGLFNDELLPVKKASYLDVFAERLLEKLQYLASERDMIVLHHEFIAEYKKGSLGFNAQAQYRQEKITSTLIDFGIPNGDSAMSRTVSLPAAIGTKLILENRISLRGVCIPVMPEIYEPVLDELEEIGIVFKESKEQI